MIDAVGATTIMNRAAQPAEIAQVIVFLASPAANYITGAVIAADSSQADHHRDHGQREYLDTAHAREVIVGGIPS